MILKIIGGMFIIISSSILGFYFSYREMYRISDLDEMKRALTILISEIEFTMTPLPEAMLSISDKINQPIKDILFQFSQSLKLMNGEGVYENWKNIISENRKNTYFLNEDIENFNSFGKTLGYLDKKMQINSIKLTLQYIDNKVNELNQSRMKNKKMYQSLGVLGGLVLVIVLI